MFRHILMAALLMFSIVSYADDSILAQLEQGLGTELAPDQAALITSEMQKIEEGEKQAQKDPGEWFVLVCGGGQGGLMPAFPAGAQGALCTDFTGRGFWLGGLNLGLIGGASAQLGAILLRVYNTQPTGQYWALQGGSSLAAAGLGITYGVDFGSGNLLMRLVYAPGVALDLTLSTIWINPL